MTIEYNRNHYVKVGNYSNVVMELDKTRVTPDANTKVILCSFMEQLIYKVALQHPEWTIVAIDAMWTTQAETWRSHKFNVYRGSEYIGMLRRDGYYEDSYKYEVYNDRIANVRRKRGGICSKDLKKTLKTIAGHFKPRSHEELRRKALSDMASHRSNVAWRSNRAANEMLSRMAPSLLAYLTTNMSSVRGELETLGISPVLLDSLPGHLEKIKGMADVEAAARNRTGTTVLLLDDRYMLIPDADIDNPQIVTASQLSPDMSRKIGVLKLFEDSEEALEGIGMRYDAKTFYLVP